MRFAKQSRRCVSSKTLSVVLALVVLLFCLPSAWPAPEPVTITLEGIEGDVLKNVREALVVPQGLVREGKVDRLWLERFVQQAEEIVRTAM